MALSQHLGQIQLVDWNQFGVYHNGDKYMPDNSYMQVFIESNLPCQCRPRIQFNSCYPIPGTALTPLAF